MGLNISTFIPTGWKMGLTNNLYWADLDLDFDGWRVLNMYVFTEVSFNVNIGLCSDDYFFNMVQYLILFESTWMTWPKPKT